MGGNMPRRQRIARIAIEFMIGWVVSSCLRNYMFIPSVPNRDGYSSVLECDPSEEIEILRLQMVSLVKENLDLLEEFKKLQEKLQLELTAQVMGQVPRQHLQHSEPHKVGPFGTVKGIRTNLMVRLDESVNLRLAKILNKVAIKKELIVALADSNVWDMLEIWFTSIQNVGIPNYMVVALDDETASLCKSKGVPYYRRGPDEGLDSIGWTGSNHANISGLKFYFLREFLQLGYSVLLSDVDIVYLQNPFYRLYRDSDVECMRNGHNNITAYDYDDIFDACSTWGHACTMRMYDPGFFFMRPTIPSIELLDRVVDQLAWEAGAWDQAVFNEELFYHSRPGYNGLCAATRTMDFYLFMNSKVLFKTVRKDPNLSKLKPVVVHLNYHPDKIPRMRAVVDFYVHGKADALKPFPDDSEW